MLRGCCTDRSFLYNLTALRVGLSETMANCPRRTNQISACRFLFCGCSRSSANSQPIWGKPMTCVLCWRVLVLLYIFLSGLLDAAIVGDKKECRASHYGKLDVLFHCTEDVLTTLTGLAFVLNMGFNLFSLNVVQAKEVVVSDEKGVHFMGGRLISSRSKAGFHFK